MRLAEAAAAPAAASILDRLVLRAGEVWSGRGAGAAAPVCVRVQRGTAWVTQEGDAADHVLRVGEAYCARGRGLLVIEAVEDVVLVMRPREGPRGRGRAA